MKNANEADQEKLKPDLTWLDEYDKVVNRLYLQLFEHYNQNQFSMEESFRDVELLKKLKSVNKEYIKFCRFRTNNSPGAGRTEFFWDNTRWNKLFLRLSKRELISFKELKQSEIFNREFAYFVVNQNVLKDIQAKVFIDSI